MPTNAADIRVAENREISGRSWCVFESGNYLLQPKSTLADVQIVDSRGISWGYGEFSKNFPVYTTRVITKISSFCLLKKFQPMQRRHQKLSLVLGIVQGYLSFLGFGRYRPNRSIKNNHLSGESKQMQRLKK